MTPSSEERVGQVLLDKFLVLRRLGGGGMGEVFEVQHLLTRHLRALKIVHAELAKEPRFAERFRREASIAGRLKTPFVAETFDAGWLEDGSAYVLMELCPGRSLHALLSDEGMLPARRTAVLMCQIAEGIQVAHDASIVHRDLKPENILVETTEDGRDRVKILDFGVSKQLAVSDEAGSRLTREGSAVGTPYYMSPEQAAGKNVDGRSDVWSIGVMTYELLTGRLPFDGANAFEVMLKIGAGTYVPLEHRRPDLDLELVAIVARALAPDPAERYPSADALRRDLLPFAGGEPAMRAKTISDGAPVVRVPAPLPAPAPVPAGPETTSVRPPPAAADPPAATEPPAPPREDRSSTLVLGLGLSTVVLAAILLAVGLGEGTSAATSVTAPDAGVRVAIPPPLPEPMAAPAIEASEPPATAPTLEEGAETLPRDRRERDRRRPTPAERAGLEGSPYE